MGGLHPAFFITPGVVLLGLICVLPVPRRLQQTYGAGRSSGFRIILWPRLPAHHKQWLGLPDPAAIVSGHSGGTATESHRLPD